MMTVTTPVVAPRRVSHDIILLAARLVCLVSSPRSDARCPTARSLPTPPHRHALRSGSPHGHHLAPGRGPQSPLSSLLLSAGQPGPPHRTPRPLSPALGHRPAARLVGPAPVRPG